MRPLIFILSILVFFSCEEENTADDLSVDFNSIQDQQHYDNASQETDPFELNWVVLDDWILSLSVSYSGGCEDHDFTLVWPEGILAIYPPQFIVFVTHDGNGDLCEAYPTETLTFDLSNNPLGLNLETLQAAKFGVVNASNSEEVFYPNE
ncbi:MAG: hypothetical protein JXR07_00380 [Reichenbachiella sp.]